MLVCWNIILMYNDDQLFFLQPRIGNKRYITLGFSVNSRVIKRLQKKTRGVWVSLLYIWLTNETRCCSLSFTFHSVSTSNVDGIHVAKQQKNVLTLLWRHKRNYDVTMCGWRFLVSRSVLEYFDRVFHVPNVSTIKVELSFSSAVGLIRPLCHKFIRNFLLNVNKEKVMNW